MQEQFDVVIVGGGHAGASLVASLKQKKLPDLKILLLSEEAFWPYHRPPLSKAWLMGDMVEKRLNLFPETLYEGAGCEVRLGQRVLSVNAEDHTITCDGGAVIGYGKLVLATGGAARRLNLPGANDPRVRTLRTRADSDAMRDAYKPGQTLVVIGGGYIGLEVAASARKLGLTVILLEAAPRILARVTSPEVSAFYTDVHRAEGVDVRLSAKIEGFNPLGKQLSVNTEEGLIMADHVLVGIGLEPEVSLAQSAGITPENGIPVNAYCQTDVPDIYAIGDNAAAPVPLYGGQRLRVESVQNAVDQAATVAAHIAGTPVEYDPMPWFWSDQYDLKLKIAGLSTGFDSVIERGDRNSREVSFCYLKEGRLIAVDAINRTADFVAGQKLIRAGKPVDVAVLENAEIPLKTLLE